MPEFGDSHGLTSTQFFEKLQAKYAANENGDRGYLNYLFKSMGYSNGFADAQEYMFSEETLPIGSRGVLGLGKQHHYATQYCRLMIVIVRPSASKVRTVQLFTS